MMGYRDRCEGQFQCRSPITGLIVVVASAIQGGLTQTGLNKHALPLTIMLIILGLFGMLASMKLYERARRHTRLGFLIRFSYRYYRPLYSQYHTAFTENAD